ncbi:MAG: hypothetical protein ACD_20C00147G0014 [uncultured bacterium]|nr:MAG: hypothetical protein ACD_20C00147G0014 [uncultured bacterium]HBH17941.1 hypothetical protein [Cyanobacteria bacterium UBA9579]
MLNKLGLIQNFTGRIEIDQNCRDKEAISKALTPELKQKIKNKLPEDCVLKFTPYDASLLETSKYVGCSARKESLTVNEFVKKSINNAIKLYKEFQDPGYGKKIRDIQLQRMKELKEYIKSLGDKEEKDK